MDLWPCSSNDLGHLTRQEVDVQRVSSLSDSFYLNFVFIYTFDPVSFLVELAVEEYQQENEGLAPAKVGASADNHPIPTSASSVKIVYPDTLSMAIYDPRQKRGPNAPVQPGGPINMPSSSGVIAGAGGGPPNLVDIMKTLPLALASFVASLPAVEGPSPDVDYVLSVCLQSNIPPLPGRPLQASSAPEHAPKLNPNRGDRRSGSRQTRQR